MSLADGTSLGAYVEAGYRVGGTGFGAGATVSQSLDYNFDKKEVSTTTAAGAYASFGAANASVGASYNHQASRFDWSATVGVGIGSNGAGAGMGLSVGYGSQGIIWGVGGWGRGPANAMADKRAQRAAAKTAQNASGVQKYIISGTEAEKQAIRKYIDGSGSLSNAEVAKGLAAMGYSVSQGAGGYIEVAKGASSVLLNTSRQLQAKFKHAGDFGVEGNYSKANATKFNSAINQHINSEGIQTIQGTYRGQPVIHIVNPNSGLNVISSPSGQFISGWKLNPAQLQNVLKHGGL